MKLDALVAMKIEKLFIYIKTTWAEWAQNMTYLFFPEKEIQFFFVIYVISAELGSELVAATEMRIINSPEPIVLDNLKSTRC